MKPFLLFISLAICFSLNLVVVSSHDSDDHVKFSESCDLKVIQPQRLKDLFVKTSGLIPHTLSQQGTIPWGKTVSGKLELAQPFDACTSLNYTSNKNSEYSQLSRPFLLIELSPNDRCSLETKIYHAQNYGASLVIVVVQKDGLDTIPIADQKKLSLVSIPVLAVSSTIGLTLKNSVESSQPDSQPTLVATFPMKEITRYHIDVYLDVDSLETYTLLTALSLYNDQHPHKHEFTMKYKIMESIFEEDSEEDNDDGEINTKQQQLAVRIAKSCFYNGKYCNEANPSALREIIRQVCVARYSTETFFQYAIFMGQQYNVYLQKQIQNIFETSDFSPFDFDAASNNAISQVSMGKDLLENCYEASFVTRVPRNTEETSVPTSNKDDGFYISYQSENLILDEQLQIWEKLNNAHSQLPFVVLNHMEIYPVPTKKYTDQVITTLCAADNDDSSSFCAGQFKYKKSTTNGRLSTGNIILIIFGALSGSILICYIAAKLYIRYQKRSYSGELDKVDSMVQSYIELNSDRENHPSS